MEEVKEFATVRDIFIIMKGMIANGCADYIVTCNKEYYLARKGDEGSIDNKERSVDLGGYT